MDRVDVLLDELCARSLNAEAAAKVFDRVLREIIGPHHQSMSWGDRLLTLDKSAGFLDDPAFGKALKKAQSSTGANQYESPHGISWRYNTLIWAARSALAVPGDFVECGVYRGDMTWMITQNIDFTNSSKTFYLYDTFSGLDERYSSEADFPDSPDLYTYANREYGATDIEHSVRARFEGNGQIIITKGVVPDILHHISPRQIAFLHLDLNSPRAEFAALEVLFDRVSSGGIIMFDDYGWKIFRKQKEAADAFMSQRGETVLELPTGQGLTIKRGRHSE